MRTNERVTVVQLMGYTIKAYERMPSEPDGWLFPEMGPNHAITVAVRNAVTGEPGCLHVEPSDIAREIEAIPNIIAYQILDAAGNGAAVLL